MVAVSADHRSEMKGKPNKAFRISCTRSKRIVLEERTKKGQANKKSIITNIVIDYTGSDTFFLVAHFPRDWCGPARVHLHSFPHTVPFAWMLDNTLSPRSLPQKSVVAQVT